MPASIHFADLTSPRARALLDSGKAGDGQASAGNQAVIFVHVAERLSGVGGVRVERILGVRAADDGKLATVADALERYASDLRSRGGEPANAGASPILCPSY